MKIQKIGVIGAGSMGSGIAQVCAGNMVQQGYQANETEALVQSEDCGEEDGGF